MVIKVISSGLTSQSPGASGSLSGSSRGWRSPGWTTAAAVLTAGRPHPGPPPSSGREAMKGQQAELYQTLSKY